MDKFCVLLLVAISAILSSNNCLSQTTYSRNNGVSNKITDSIHLQRQIDSLLKTVSDTLERNIIDASQQLFEAELALRKDTSHSSSKLVELLILHNKRGIRLHDALMRLYAVGLSCVKPSSDQQELISKTQPKNTVLWLEKYFGNRTTQGALESIDIFRRDVLLVSKSYSDKAAFM